jgi:hypothetical protein
VNQLANADGYHQGKRTRQHREQGHTKREHREREHGNREQALHDGEPQSWEHQDFNTRSQIRIFEMSPSLEAYVRDSLRRTMSTDSLVHNNWEIVLSTNLSAMTDNLAGDKKKARCNLTGISASPRNNGASWQPKILEDEFAFANLSFYHKHYSTFYKHSLNYYTNSYPYSLNYFMIHIMPKLLKSASTKISTH